MAETTKYLDLTGLTLYDTTIKDYINKRDAKIEVKEDDGTVVITDNNGEDLTGGKKLKVNIDGETLVKNSDGVISVASNALTLYIGDKKSIIVGDADADNNKEISLKINASDQFLTATTTEDAADGLKVDLKIGKFDAAALASMGDANVKEAYALIGKNNTVITGDNYDQVIKIYKDSSLLDVKLLHATDEAKPAYTKATGTWTDVAEDLQTEANLALCFAYERADGTVTVEAIAVGNFLRESEFGDGLQVINGNVSVKYTSEKVRIANTPSGVTPGAAEDTGLVDVLTVTAAGGVTINHIQDAIDYAANAAANTIDTTVTGESASHMTITETTQTDGHTEYAFELTDVASLDALEDEVTRAGNAETAIDSAIGLTKADDSETRTWSPAANSNYGADTTTVKDTIAALDTALKDVSDGLNAFTPITTAEINALFA